MSNVFVAQSGVDAAKTNDDLERKPASAINPAG
jgi:hypothetical protein